MLDDLITTPSERTKDIPFQGRLQYLKVYQVPIGLPKYRLNNGRTYAAQAEYLAKHAKLSADFFTRDPESDEAIKVQHVLLRDEIKDGAKELLAFFKKHQQEDPFILTREGFVVNGNRRICAMRELVATDPTKFGHFEHIDVVILPPADEKDIDELEAILQIREDIEADYSWTTFALMVRRRKEEHHYTIEQLKKLYEKKGREVDEVLDMLDYAEHYLSERGWAGQYHRVEDADYAFQQIRKKRDKLSSEQEKEFFEKTAYALLDNPKGGRLYDLIPKSANYIDKIIGKIEEEFEISGSSTPYKEASAY